MFRTVYERFTSGRTEPETEKPKITRRHFPSLYKNSMKIEVLVSDNPKREGTSAYTNFFAICDSNTVGEALNLGVPYKAIDDAVQREYIRVRSDD